MLCIVCIEVWPIGSQAGDDPHEYTKYVCTRCKQDNNLVNLFSDENNMNSGEVPSALHNSTQVEEM